ncbi:Major facilitator superfamily transporter [Cordyceps javanica]|nr:Major facilitator superfamily transporter [Cordyceps javanica]
MAARLGWQWIFWILAILGGFCLALLIIALPETSRAVVGNGSVVPRGIYRSLIPISRVKRDKQGTNDNVKKKNVTFFNPLALLKILLSFRLSNVLICNGITYTVYCCIQASLSSLFIDVYGYHDIEAGLIYIPFGVACLFSILTWGKRLLSPKQASTDPAQEQSSIANMRAPPSTMELLWMKQSPSLTRPFRSKSHAFVAALYSSELRQWPHVVLALGAFNTDLNTHQSSTASAAANIVRCALAAAFLSILQIMIEHIGPGWCFTIFGLIMLLCGASLYWQITIGYQRRVREQIARPGRTQDGLRFRSHRPSLFELTWHHINMFAETAAAAFVILLGVDCGGGRGDPPSLDLFAAYLECKALFVGNPMAFSKQCSLRHLVSGWNLYAAVHSVPSWIGK